MSYLGLSIVFLALALVPTGLLVGDTPPLAQDAGGGTRTTRPAPERGVRTLGRRTAARRAAVAGAALVVLVVLTAVFDSLMIWAGFFSYDEASISGPRIGLAPIEDFTYVVAAVILLPSLWWALEHRGRVAADLRMLFSTSRPVSWVNTAYPFAAGYLLAVREVDALLMIGTIFFLVPYNLMMYGINDVFDYESDLLNPRKGGLEGALVERSGHRRILAFSVLTALPFVLLLIQAGTAASSAVLGVSLFAVVAYSLRGLRFKEIPFLDSATSAVHFVSPLVFALVLGGQALTPGLWALCGAFFLWSMASQAFGAVQDVTADRAAGLASIATVLGARATVRTAAGLYLGAILLLLLAPWPAPLAALAVVPYLANVAPYLRLTDAQCERAHAGWRRFLWLNMVAGFVVTLLLIWAWQIH